MIVEGLSGKSFKSKAIPMSGGFKPSTAEELFAGMGRSIEDARRAAGNE